jgi:hypothetical protein
VVLILGLRLGDRALLVGRIEDLRAVGGPDQIFIEVGSVDLEEELEHAPVGDQLRIEDDLLRRTPEGGVSVLSPARQPLKHHLDWRTVVAVARVAGPLDFPKTSR